jgi:hypothetical protein
MSSVFWEDAVMLKKILIFVLALGFTVLAACANRESTYQPRTIAFVSSTPGGAYEMSGPIKINLTVPGIITANVSSPNMGVLGGFIGLSANFTGSSGTPDNFAMKMDLMGTPMAISGTWTSTSATKFKAVANLDPLIEEIRKMGGQATVTKNTYTGTVLPNGQLKGNFGLGVNLSLQGITMKLSISANYKANPVDLVASGLSQKLLGQPEPLVLNSHFATMFEQVVKVANLAK